MFFKYSLFSLLFFTFLHLIFSDTESFIRSFPNLVFHKETPQNILFYTSLILFPSYVILLLYYSPLMLFLSYIVPTSGFTVSHSSFKPNYPEQDMQCLPLQDKERH